MFQECRGVSYCSGDEEACGPQLRCPADTTQYNMSTIPIPIRSYCYDDDDRTRILDNGSYELLDQTDEDLPSLHTCFKFHALLKAPLSQWQWRNPLGSDHTTSLFWPSPCHICVS